MKTSALIISLVKLIIAVILPDEKQLRLILGATAIILGRGGASLVAKELGASKSRIYAGVKEVRQLKSSGSLEDTKRHSKSCRRVRRPGGGRKHLWEVQPKIEEATREAVDNESYGNPESSILWTAKSRRRIVAELRRQGFKLSHTSVAKLLRRIGFSLQKNKKMLQVGKPHPDRDAQFKHIFAKTADFTERKLPVLSIDCKKKELIGNYAASGAEYAPKGNPVKTLDHDFGTKRACPYGVFDIARNEAVVNVGTSADTAEFSVHSLLVWWEITGKEHYGDASEILLLADGGGSNGSRNRLWKLCLQEFANTTGKIIHVCHFPPGTSKWNKIEHRVFSQISKNWRGRPLLSLDLMVNLISATTTSSGLRVFCKLDENEYEKGKKVSEEEMNSLALERDEIHGDWNYCIRPQVVA